MLTFCILKCLFSYPTIVQHQETQGLGGPLLLLTSVQVCSCPRLVNASLYLQTVPARQGFPGFSSLAVLLKTHSLLKVFCYTCGYFMDILRCL